MNVSGNLPDEIYIKFGSLDEVKVFVALLNNSFESTRRATGIIAHLSDDEIHGVQNPIFNFAEKMMLNYKEGE